jgi:hypothetical protein
VLADNFEMFLDYVIKEQLPLDFFSYHSYGSEFKEYLYRTNIVREKLTARPQFHMTEMHMNELNIIPAPWEHDDTPLNGHEFIPHIFECIQDLLEETDVTLIHWAQWLNSGVDHLGMVDTEGILKPAYHAFWMYAFMPVDRYPVQLSPATTLKAMASADDDKACILVWNTSSLVKPVHLSIDDINFEVDSMDCYTINEHSYGRNDWLKAEGITEHLESGHATITGDISGKGTLFIVLKKRQSSVSPEQTLISANVIRKHHYYPERGKKIYADFDEQLWTARLGMGNEPTGHALVGVTAEAVPNLLQIQLESVVEELSPQARLGIRIDYQVDGEFVNAVEFCYGQEETRLVNEYPWGTIRDAEQVIMIDAHEFSVNISDYAPKQWNGRVLFSFEMRDAGENARAKFIVKNAAHQ